MKTIIIVLLLSLSLLNVNALDITIQTKTMKKPDTLTNAYIFKCLTKYIYISHSKGLSIIKYEDIAEKDRYMFDVMTFKTNDGILHSAVTIVTFDRDVVIMSQPIHGNRLICEPWSNMPYDIKQMFGYGIPLHKDAYPYSDAIDVNNHMTFQLIMMHFLQYR